MDRYKTVIELDWKEGYISKKEAHSIAKRAKKLMIGNGERMFPDGLPGWVTIRTRTEVVDA